MTRAKTTAAAVLLGLTLASCSSAPSAGEKELAAMKAQVATAQDAQAAAEAQTRLAVNDETLAKMDTTKAVQDLATADERAQAKANAAVMASYASKLAALAGREKAATARELALTAREKAVGGAEAAAKANTFAGDGVYLVGSDIRPGTYKSAGGDNCYWERNDKAGAILDNHIGAGPTVVVVSATDFSLQVSGCAEFHKS